MTHYESEIIAPSFFEDEDAAFLIDRVRELGCPVIVVRFEGVSGVEAQTRVAEINRELASRGLSQFPSVRRRRGPVDRRVA